MFYEIEYDTAKVDDGNEDGYVGDKEVGHFAVGHPGNDNWDAIDPPDNREEAQGNP